MPCGLGTVEIVTVFQELTEKNFHSRYAYLIIQLITLWKNVPELI